MSELRYRPGLGAPNKLPENFGLGENECTIYSHAAVGDWAWVMAFCFRRTTDQKLETRHVPVAPNREWEGGRTPWGLRHVATGRWQVSPSIKCTERRGDAPDPNEDVEVWHETPAIVGVPEDEPWTRSNL